MLEQTLDPYFRMFQTSDTFKDVNSFLATTAIGSPKTSMSEVLGGINHRGTPNRVPINKDYYGLAFFTRPQMNLKTSNLLRDRRFTRLLTNKAESIPRAVRAYLDYTCDNWGTESYTCPLVDQKNIFIPLLTNHLISMSGWPDIDLNTYTTDKGIIGEEIVMVDSTTEIVRSVDLTCNFRNMPGSPILVLGQIWQLYMSNVFLGRLLPHAENMVDNTIDYNTRIYRIVLDNTKRYVQDIASAVAFFPVNVPMGARFNFESDTPINKQMDQISITFRGSIIEYSDDILINEFNTAVCLANSDMLDTNRDMNMAKVTGPYLHHFNYAGYPRINPGTYELEWWVTKRDWHKVVGLDGADAEYYDYTGINPAMISLD